MPLPPEGKTKWPPESMKAAQELYHINGTWYGGDPDRLASLYGNTSPWDRVDTRYRAMQFRGGVVGRVARWFWGVPPADGELRAKLHLPVASDIAGMSANLLFAEPPKLKVEDQATQERLDTLTVDMSLQATLLEGGEVDAALGDVYLVPSWDTEIRDHPWLRVVHGDAVVPEWKGRYLKAATVWAVVHDDAGDVWRHLERYEMAGGECVIFHGLFKGDSSTIGWSKPLDAMPATEGLDEVVRTGVKRLLVEHVPNLRPNRLDRGSPLGRSVYSPGALSLMDELDEVWSSFARDFRLAKARAVITEDALRSQGPGQGAIFDDRELLLPLRLPPNPQQGAKPLELIQPMIRVQDHLTGARALTEEIIRTCGFSVQSFGLGGVDGAPQATATEIQQRQAQSYLTRGMQTLFWGAGIARSIQSLLEIDAEVFKSKITPQRPDVEFGDTVAESDATTAQTANLWRQANAASTETIIRLVHPEWDDERVEKEKQAILAEDGSNVPDPFATAHADHGVPTDLTPADGQDANAPQPIPGR